MRVGLREKLKGIEKIPAALLRKAFNGDFEQMLLCYTFWLSNYTFGLESIIWSCSVIHK
jgi:hypothetical protein